MYNTYRDPTSCYGDHNVATYPQNVEESSKMGPAAPWQMQQHAAPSPHYPYHSASAMPDAYGYAISQVHKETDPSLGKDHVRSTPSHNSTPSNPVWQNNRPRYSRGVGAGGAFLPYPHIGHFEGSPLETAGLIHGHSHGRKPAWPVENSYSTVPGQPYQREASMVYADNRRPAGTTSIIRHTTSVSSSQQPQQHLQQQQSQQSLLHQQQQQQHLAPHHQLFSQLVQKEREARRLPGYQESVRHSVVRAGPPAYHDPLFPQHQHPQYCNSQEMLRKPPFLGTGEMDRCSAFTARQGPSFNHMWNKGNMPYLPYHPQMPPSHRTSGSAFQPCGKVADSEMYPAETLMWVKGNQPDHSSHSQISNLTNGHPLRSVQTSTGWIGEAQAQMFSSRQMHKQDMSAANSSNMLNMDTQELEPPSGRQGNILSVSYHATAPHQHVHQHAIPMSSQISQHPSQQPPLPPPLPPPPPPPPHQSPLTNPQHSPMLQSPHPNIQSPCPQPQQHVRYEEDSKDGSSNSRSLRSCLDVRQFLATWDEDTDIGTPRPCVEESDISENLEQPVNHHNSGSLVVLESRSLQSEEAANLLNIFPSVDINAVSGADGLLACSGENMFDGASEAVVMDTQAVAQGVLQNLLDSACGTSSGSSSTTIATPMTSPSARTLDILLCGALPTPPASQEHNVIQTSLPLNTPVSMPVLTTPHSPQTNEPKIDESGFGLLSPSPPPPLSLKFDNSSVNPPSKFPVLDDSSIVIQSNQAQLNFVPLPSLETSEKREVSVISGPVRERLLSAEQRDVCSEARNEPAREVDAQQSPLLSDVSTDGKNVADLRAYRKRKLNSPDHGCDNHDSFGSHNSPDNVESHPKASKTYNPEDSPLDRSKWAFAQIHENAQSFSAHRSPDFENALKSVEGWDLSNAASNNKLSRAVSCSTSDFLMVERSVAVNFLTSSESSKSDNLKLDRSSYSSVVLSNKDTQTDENRLKLLTTFNDDAHSCRFSDSFVQTTVGNLQEGTEEIANNNADLRSIFSQPPIPSDGTSALNFDCVEPAVRDVSTTTSCSKSDKENNEELESAEANVIDTFTQTKVSDLPDMSSLSSNSKETESKKIDILVGEAKYNSKKEISPKYHSRIVNSSPGNIPKILLSRLRGKPNEKNGVIKKLPSIRLTRVNSPMSNSSSEPEYVCSVSDSERGTQTRFDMTDASSETVENLCLDKAIALETSYDIEEPHTHKVCGDKNLNTSDGLSSINTVDLNAGRQLQPLTSSLQFNVGSISTSGEKVNIQENVNSFSLPCFSKESECHLPRNTSSVTTQSEEQFICKEQVCQTTASSQTMIDKCISPTVSHESGKRNKGTDAMVPHCFEEENPRLSTEILEPRRSNGVTVLQSFSAVDQNKHSVLDVKQMSTQCELVYRSITDEACNASQIVYDPDAISNSKHKAFEADRDLNCPISGNEAKANHLDPQCEKHNVSILSDETNSVLEENVFSKPHSPMQHPFEDLVDQLEKFSSQLEKPINDSRLPQEDSEKLSSSSEKEVEVLLNQKDPPQNGLRNSLNFSNVSSSKGSCYSYTDCDMSVESSKTGDTDKQSDDLKVTKLEDFPNYGVTHDAYSAQCRVVKSTISLQSDNLRNLETMPVNEMSLSVESKEFDCNANMHSNQETVLPTITSPLHSSLESAQQTFVRKQVVDNEAKPLLYEDISAPILHKEQSSTSNSTVHEEHVSCVARQEQDLLLDASLEAGPTIPIHSEKAPSPPILTNEEQGLNTNIADEDKGSSLPEDYLGSSASLHNGQELSLSRFEEKNSYSSVFDEQVSAPDLCKEQATISSIADERGSTIHMEVALNPEICEEHTSSLSILEERESNPAKFNEQASTFCKEQATFGEEQASAFCKEPALSPDMQEEQFLSPAISDDQVSSAAICEEQSSSMHKEQVFSPVIHEEQTSTVLLHEERSLGSVMDEEHTSSSLINEEQISNVLEEHVSSPLIHVEEASSPVKKREQMSSSTIQEEQAPSPMALLEQISSSVILEKQVSNRAVREKQALHVTIQQQPLSPPSHHEKTSANESKNNYFINDFENYRGSAYQENTYDTTIKNSKSYDFSEDIKSPTEFIASSVHCQVINPNGSRSMELFNDELDSLDSSDTENELELHCREEAASTSTTRDEESHVNKFDHEMLENAKEDGSSVFEAGDILSLSNNNKRSTVLQVENDENLKIFEPKTLPLSDKCDEETRLKKEFIALISENKGPEKLSNDKEMSLDSKEDSLLISIGEHGIAPPERNIRPCTDKPFEYEGAIVSSSDQDTRILSKEYEKAGCLVEEHPQEAHLLSKDDNLVIHGTEDEPACPDKCALRNSEGSCTLSDEEQAFPDPGRPDFDVTRIPLPDECEAIKIRFRDLRSKKLGEKDSNIIEAINQGNKEVCSAFREKRIGESHAVSVAVQCSQITNKRKTFGFQSKASQTHKIKIKLRPRPQSNGESLTANSQTLMEVVDEVSQILDDKSVSVSLPVFKGLQWSRKCDNTLTNQPVSQISHAISSCQRNLKKDLEVESRTNLHHAQNNDCIIGDAKMQILPGLESSKAQSCPDLWCSNNSSKKSKDGKEVKKTCHTSTKSENEIQDSPCLSNPNVTAKDINQMDFNESNINKISSKNQEMVLTDDSSIGCNLLKSEKEISFREQGSAFIPSKSLDLCVKDTHCSHTVNDGTHPHKQSNTEVSNPPGVDMEFKDVIEGKIETSSSASVNAINSKESDIVDFSEGKKPSIINEQDINCVSEEIGKSHSLLQLNGSNLNCEPRFKKTDEQFATTADVRMKNSQEMKGSFAEDIVTGASSHNLKIAPQLRFEEEFCHSTVSSQTQQYSSIDDCKTLISPESMSHKGSKISAVENEARRGTGDTEIMSNQEGGICADGKTLEKTCHAELHTNEYGTKAPESDRFRDESNIATNMEKVIKECVPEDRSDQKATESHVGLTSFDKCSYEEQSDTQIKNMERVPEFVQINTEKCTKLSKEDKPFGKSPRAALKLPIPSQCTVVAEEVCDSTLVEPIHPPERPTASDVASPCEHSCEPDTGIPVSDVAPPDTHLCEGEISEAGVVSPDGQACESDRKTTASDIATPGAHLCESDKGMTASNVTSLGEHPSEPGEDMPASDNDPLSAHLCDPDEDIPDSNVASLGEHPSEPDNVPDSNVTSFDEQPCKPDEDIPGSNVTSLCEHPSDPDKDIPDSNVAMLCERPSEPEEDMPASDNAHLSPHLCELDRDIPTSNVALSGEHPCEPDGHIPTSDIASLGAHLCKSDGDIQASNVISSGEEFCEPDGDMPASNLASPDEHPNEPDEDIPASNLASPGEHPCEPDGNISAHNFASSDEHPCEPDGSLPASNFASLDNHPCAPDRNMPFGKVSDAPDEHPCDVNGDMQAGNGALPGKHPFETDGDMPVNNVASPGGHACEPDGNIPVTDVASLRNSCEPSEDISARDKAERGMVPSPAGHSCEHVDVILDSGERSWKRDGDILETGAELSRSCVEHPSNIDEELSACSLERNVLTYPTEQCCEPDGDVSVGGVQQTALSHPSEHPRGSDEDISASGVEQNDSTCPAENSCGPGEDISLTYVDQNGVTSGLTVASPLGETNVERTDPCRSPLATDKSELTCDLDDGDTVSPQTIPITEAACGHIEKDKLEPLSRPPRQDSSEDDLPLPPLEADGLESADAAGNSDSDREMPCLEPAGNAACAFDFSKPLSAPRKEMPSAPLHSDSDSESDDYSCGRPESCSSPEPVACQPQLAQTPGELTHLEISDIRTVSVSDMSVWSGSDVVPVPVDSVYNWPYVEEVFTEASGDTPAQDWVPEEHEPEEEQSQARLQLRCSLSWDRILPEGERLVLGPAKIEVRLADSPTKGVACWNVINRDCRRDSAESVASSCQEENNNLVPGAKSPLVMVKKLILKRPNDRRHAFSHSESDLDSGMEGGSTPHERGSQMKTKGALKSYHQAESERAARRKRSWHRGGRGRGVRGSRSSRGKRWYSELSSPGSRSTTRSPGAADSDVSCGEVPKVIIKRKNSDPDGGRLCYESYLHVPNEEPDQLRLTPVVVLCRDPRLDAMARELHARRRKRFKSDPLPGASRKTPEPEAPQKEKGNTSFLHVVELLKRWRQEEEEKAAAEGNADLVPQYSSCWDRMDTDFQPAAAAVAQQVVGEPSPVEPEQVEHWDHHLSPCMVSGESPVEDDSAAHRCDACEKLLRGSAARAKHIKEHPYHCQRCFLAFPAQTDFMQHLKIAHPNTQELHHCLLCLQTFPTEEQHAEHIKSWSHEHMERSQRRTIHTLYRMFTGTSCPRLSPLTDKDIQALDWPSDSGVIHFYHQATPLQIAMEDWHVKHGKPSSEETSS